MNCDLDILIDYSENNISNSKKILVEEHINHCKKCNLHLQSLDLTNQLFSNELEYSKNILSSIENRIDINQYTKNTFNLQKFFIKIRPILAPVMIIAIVISCIIFIKHSNSVVSNKNQFIKFDSNTNQPIISKFNEIIPASTDIIKTTPTQKALSSVPINTQISSNDRIDYKLVWSDEFSSDQLDKSKWQIQTGDGGWGNNELQHYTDRNKNIRIEDGKLIIEAHKENYEKSSFTSSRIQSITSWQYGKIEIKAKIPLGQGLWPSIWLMGSNYPNVKYPNCGGIDVMSHINSQLSINGLIHWDFNGPQQYGNTFVVDLNQYHIYSIEWNQSYIKWFVDGIEYCEANILNNINGTEEFHLPFSINIDLAVGGNWPGAPDNSTKFPSQMYIDFIKYFKK